MLAVDGSQTATAFWADVSSMLVNTFPGGEIRITYFLEATTNDVDVQIQGSVNNINWIPLNTRDLVRPDMQNTIITVPNGGSAVAVISPTDFNGVNSGFQYYRMQIMGNSPYGTLSSWATAK